MKVWLLILIVLLIIVAITVGPLVTIWALNTLFPPLAIPFTFHTWLAALCLFGGIKGATSNSGKSK